MTNYNQLVSDQKIFFNTNKTKDLEFRKSQLRKLLFLLRSSEKDLNEAIYLDFRKSSFENYATELSIIFHEIDLAIKHLDQWAKRIRVSTDLANFPSKSYIIPEPLGNILVIGAWNYPFQLSILPAVSAIAAGNTVIIKPSELATETSKIMAKLINENFDATILHVIEGSVRETTELLKLKFDKIFFTGSPAVGKVILKAAAEHLCPVTLELGGKSPTFILKSTKLKIAAKRIVWAKFLNGGQTCVAPDYLLVENSIKSQFIEMLKNEIKRIHSPEPIKSEALARIINARHFERLIKLIDQKKVIYGGDYNLQDLYIAPTIIDNVSFEDNVMQEEIFGPLLPIIEFEDLNWAIKQVKENPKPLALYIFGNNRKQINQIQEEISFGGGAINDAIMHFTNTNLPFGGVGNSGMGSYHGKYGFDTFTHYKSILDKQTWFEPNIKYSPYTSFKKKLLQWLVG